MYKIVHGGDIYHNKINYDFSANVNPLGIPRKVKNEIKKSAKNAVHYPDIGCAKLKKMLAKKIFECYGSAPFSDLKNNRQAAPNFEFEDKICFGNGASELILAFVRAVKSKSALLFAPSFFGYVSALNSAGAKINYFYLREESEFALSKKDFESLKLVIMSKKYDTILIANPNNPNGKLLSRNSIKEIADCCEFSGVNLLIDECFIELTGKSKEFSFIPLLQNQKYQKTVVLRAFTKTFAIPGIRLGYCVSSSETAKKIKNQLPEWNISVAAQEAGCACLLEKKYLEKSVKLLEKERKYLSEKLAQIGFKVFPSDANYILFKDSNFCQAKKLFSSAKIKKSSEKSEISENLKQYLLCKKILIRCCADYEGLKKGFYRIAVKSRRENRRLLHFLRP